MPRRPRRDGEESAVTGGASPTDSQAAVDSASTAPTAQSPTNDPTTPAGSEPAAAASTRRPRRRSGSTGSAPPAESPAAVIATADAEPIKRAASSRRPSRTAAEKAQQQPADVLSDTSSQPETAARSRRRGIGGRRTPAEIAVASVSAPVNDDAAATVQIPGLDIDPDGPTADAANAPSRSRRSRRGGRNRRTRDQAESDKPTVDTIAVAAAAIDAAVEAEVAEDETVEPAADTTAGARRSRRGGRRRLKPGEEAATTEEGGTPHRSEETEELSLPKPFVRDYWSAPPLAPSIADLGYVPLDLGISASCDPHAPSFTINGQAYPTHLFFVNADAAQSEGDPEAVTRQIRRAAAAGIHLHTCVVYLPLKNAYEDRAFGPIDESIGTILAADPDGFIVLRIQCVPTNFWARTHPDQMVKYRDGSEGDVSVASREFWTDCVDAIAAMLVRLAEPQTPGHGRVFALHLDKGEWFYEPGPGFDYSLPNQTAFRAWLHEHYQSAYALRAAWFDNSVTFDAAEVPPFDNTRDKKLDTVIYDRKRDRRHVDYVTYASSIVASAICGVAKAVKELTQDKLMVIAPYGYLFEFASRNDSGHQALGQVLRCPYIDALTGPNSYLSRAAGGVGGFAAPVDSVRLHDKLWIVEDDTKTYLAADNTPDTYNPKIPGQQETIMVHRRNYFAALAHGCGLAWMDLWGQGWLDSDSIWDEIGAMIATSEAILSASGPLHSAPDAAVLIDEASFAWVRDDLSGQQLQSGLIAKARDLLLRSGANVGFYLQSDVDALPASVKVVFFLNAIQVTTDQRQAIREKLQRPGITLVWLYAPGLFDENGLAPAEVAEIVGMPLKAQPWNSRVGTVFTEERHVVIERLHGGKRMGMDETVNPSFMSIDPQAAVLGEYSQTGNVSIAAKTVEGGWRSIFIGEPHLTGELIRGIMRCGGVHLYDVQDDIVYARGDGYMLVHAPYTGQRILHLPRPAACFSIFDDRLVSQNSSTVRIFMRGRSTHLLLWGDMETIAAKMGSSIDDLLSTLSKRPDRDSRDSGPDRDSDGRQDDEQDFGSDEQRAGDDQFAETLVAVVGDAYSEDHAEADLRNAKREASRITQELLSEIESEVDAELQSAGPASLGDLVIYEDEAEIVTGGSASETEQTSEAQPRSSSRRRRWRRKQRSSSAQGGADGQPVSVDQILSDLPPRRNRPTEPGEGV